VFFTSGNVGIPSIEVLGLLLAAMLLFLMTEIGVSCPWGNASVFYWQK